MTQSGGRITCPRCGTNNFNTVTACWKCGTALAATPLPSSAPPINAPRSEYSAYVPPSLPISGDPAVAKRAAFWLAVVFPWFGLPIGWAFMMIEDHKRQAIGKFCVMWSIVALIFHCLFVFASIQVAVSRLLPYVLQNALPQKSSGSTSEYGGSDLGGMSP